MNHSTENHKILIVDDDQINAKLLSGRLSKHNFIVQVNNTGFKVLDDINSFNPDIIILDIIFPKISGMTILKDIRKQYSSAELPVIMITSKSETSDIVNALDAGASDFITKPFQLKIALARINAHIKIKEMSALLIKTKKQEAIASMITTYNHELNNPLAIIFGKIDLLKTESQSKYVTDIENASKRIRDIVRKIYDLAAEGEIEFKPYTEKSKMIDIG